ncbi:MULTISPECIES: general secretion pathway protein GspB [Methylococcus]|uniref:Putative general secretion pathway protein B n=1 Tax=Methylococcus capsulatus (strain ATCC 33009 / NCIMB 11132 / Bath) TaxID=243233 RepID=Q60CP5_METCA|nr:general secretion pathway protein GspB [Methylococcus capsulatus]AAU90797.1 putative general secretion pathway protein B [Methylococcus capsulatus str. Bath]QXP86438.1 general secretion pathway protein GspB [Methylococcus capsulatus]QXP89345.1 general secretion pathway protein GspB [Methylococcus capsulatus]QXP93893.1 general secretion pathway protein GspB [Methylococcus capsulatus]UQN11383.1 general secretion pathway protein GspB [Methylococcus capsulatus]
MSYILDALRKSERERKLSQAASLDSVIFSPEPVPGRPWLPWVLGVVVVANVAALGYFLGLTSGSPPAPDAPASQSPPSLTREIPSMTAPVAATQPSPPPAATVPPFARRLGGADAPPRGLHPHPAAPPAAVRPVGGKGPETETGEAAEEDAGDETMAGEIDDATEAEEEDPETEAPVRKAPPPAPATPAPRRDTVPLLSEMPPSFQSRVPQLKINLFAYGPHPDDRFAVINMKRHSAGDTVAEGVRLESVDESSLTLVFEGQRFRLERP